MQVEPAVEKSQCIAVHMRSETTRSLQSGIHVDTSIPREWDGFLAYVVSQAGSPPILATLAMSLLAASLSTPQAWLWAGTYVALAVLAPVLYLVYLQRSGRITDLDVQVRQQRFRPMILALACGAAGWIVLVLGAAPLALVAVACALWLQMLIIFWVTLRWKISVHSAAAGGVAILLWHLLGTPLPLLLGVPLIAWSRVRLRRHTLAQTVAGALLGFVLLGTASLFIRPG